MNVPRAEVFQLFQKENYEGLKAQHSQKGYMGKTGCEIPLIAHSDELSLMRAAVAESCGEEN